MSKNLIAVITGPTGSGKSTVAKALCKKFDKCVRLDIDRVKHFIESGFVYDKTEKGQEQWNLCAKNVINLTNNFIEAGYTVIIEGYFSENEWKIVFDNLNVNTNFLLLPDKKITIERDKGKDPAMAMGVEAINEHYEEFNNPLYNKFITIDSSDNTLDETVEEIYKKIYE